MTNKNNIQIFLVIILSVILIVIIGFYINETNSINNLNTNNNMANQNSSIPSSNGGPGQENSNISHVGATEISSDTTNTGISYSSNTGSQNSLLVTGGTSTISNPTITKSGDSNGDNSDFYGTNVAVLVKEGTLNINGGNVNTNGSHANGIFAYKNGKINISNTKIKTTSNNSGAIMVTGGGTLTANGGDYTSNGVGSPVIYSTANITVNNATLTSTSSEGAVVEGKNSITLNNVNLTDTNTSLNGNSETYKNIFLYQSMSGDADQGNASFTAKDSTITTNKGDTIFVTNTTATISLTNNKIINNDKTGGFLRIQSGKWGNSGSNGGNVILNSINQVIDGNINVDKISTLIMKLSKNSKYTGTINSGNTAKSITLTLDNSSTLTLTSDSYITSLENADSTNSNINFNGYKLYVNGKAIN